MTSIASRMGVAAALGFSALGCYKHDIDIDVCIGFQAPAAYPVGDFPASVDLADLNGDGAPDIVWTGMSSTAMLLNRGDGTFGEAVLLDLSGKLPNDTEVADLDGDGDPDIVVAESLAHEATVLLNDGQGTFTVGPSIVVHPDEYPSRVQAIDLNGDGKVDLAFAVSSIEGSGISALFNQGDGTFAAPVSHPAGPHVDRLVAADLSGDGKPDLAFTDRDTSELHVMLQQAGGTFAKAGTYATAAKPTAIVAADLNGDGKSDLVVANWEGLDGIQVFLGEGGGTFASPLSFATRSRVESVAVVDVDRDGTPDLALARSTKDRDLALLRGLGGGIFSRPDYTDLAGAELAIAASDLNGDGAPDLALASFDSATLTVLLNCPQ